MYTMDHYHFEYFQIQSLGKSISLFTLSLIRSYHINIHDHHRLLDILEPLSVYSKYRSLCMHMTEHEVLDPCKPVNLDRFHHVTRRQRRIQRDYRIRIMLNFERHKAKQGRESNANSKW